MSLGHIWVDGVDDLWIKVYDKLAPISLRTVLFSDPQTVTGPRSKTQNKKSLQASWVHFFMLSRPEETKPTRFLHVSQWYCFYWHQKTGNLKDLYESWRHPEHLHLTNYCCPSWDMALSRPPSRIYIQIRESLEVSMEDICAFLGSSEGFPLLGNGNTRPATCWIAWQLISDS